MLDINQMNYGGKEQKPLSYKVARGILMLLSGIIMLFYLLGIAGYVTSGPSVTLLDDLTTEFIIQISLMGLGLLFLIVAWFRHISYGILALIFTIFYAVYSSVLAGSAMIGFLPIAMAADAIGFIILGIVRKYQKKKDYNVYEDPILDDMEGPDIFNFKV